MIAEKNKIKEVSLLMFARNLLQSDVVYVLTIKWVSIPVASGEKNEGG